MPPSGLWTIGIKKGLAAPGTQLGSHVSKALSRVTEAPASRANMPLQFGQPCNAAQLTTPGHDYNGDTTHQDGTTTLTMFSTAG
jgi:hypothetical protein